MFGFRFRKPPGKLIQFPVQDIKPIPPRQDGPMKEEPKPSKYADLWYAQDIILPQSPEDLEEYTTELIKAFNLPDTDFTKEMIATIIFHLPQDRSHVNAHTIAQRIQKSIANDAAYRTIGKYTEKRKAAELAAKQAETATQEASADGSSKPVQD